VIANFCEIPTGAKSKKRCEAVKKKPNLNDLAFLGETFDDRRYD